MPNPNKQTKIFDGFTWYVWLFPAIALAFCGWLFAEYLRQRGPSISISFDDASNIRAGKTQIRFRGVPIGLVERVSLSKDKKHVTVVALLDGSAQHFAIEGASFWVVMPQINLSGVSGLDTVFEGPYISALPGKPGGETVFQFRGQQGSEINEPLESTTGYTLEIQNAESLGVGDSVTFRGLKVGAITRTSLTKTGQFVLIQIVIQNRYVHLIRTNSVFLKKNGIQANLGLFGSEIKVNSLDSIVRGGIEFLTPDNPREIAKANTKFHVETAAPKGSERWNPKLDL